MTLNQKQCKPCSGDTKPLNKQVIKQYLAGLDQDWDVIADKKISKKYKLKNFNKP
jgi:hypothetical protein